MSFTHSRVGSKDDSQDAIVAAYEKLYCNVHDMSAVGGGFPDLLISVSTGRGKVLQLVEVKSTVGKLSPSQVRFQRDFGTATVVRSEADVWAHIERVREANKR